MNEDIKKYFKKQYEKANFSLVPGDYPDFKTKSEVDDWIKETETQLEILIKYAKNK